MPICFFTAKFSDGSGDIIQTIKVADYVKKNLAESKADTSPVIIVVPDTEQPDEKFPEYIPPDHKAITQRFVNDINPNILVQTISEFIKANPKMDACIQVASIEPNKFNWKKILSERITDTTPLIYMPEYSGGDWDPGNVVKVLGGFDAENGEVGVIPSHDLLQATAEDTVPREKLQSAFEQIDPKIKKYLSHNFEAYMIYRDSHDLSFQYSHDRKSYKTFSIDGGERVRGKVCTPVQFFLKEQIMLTKRSNRSQDVLCLGEDANSKKNALLELQDLLIQNGYTKISFINIDADTEETLYDSPSSTQKEFRVLYSKSVPFSTMQALPLLTNDLTGATGDNSLIEAMSAGKLVSYECASHKSNFVAGYLKAVRKETTNEKVLLLAKLLMKPVISYDLVEYNETQIDTLLGDEQVVKELKTIHRHLIARSGYFKEIDKVFSDNLLNQAKRTATGRTPLHIAAANGKLDLVKRLLESKEDKNQLNQTTPDGKTALILAIENNHVDLANYLIEKGADIHIRTQAQSNALNCAIQHNQPVLVKKLRQIYGIQFIEREFDDTEIKAAIIQAFKACGDFKVVSVIRNMLEELKTKLGPLNTKENQLAIARAGMNAPAVMNDLYLLNAIAIVVQDKVWVKPGMTLFEQKRPPGVSRIIEIIASDLQVSDKLIEIREIATEEAANQRTDNETLHGRLYKAIIQNDKSEIQSIVSQAHLVGKPQP